MRSANIIGSGPNGLTAAVTLALAGVQVSVFERNVQPGGAAATGELTLPGFLHDIGSSVFPLGIASPAFRALQLEECGLEWLQPGTPWLTLSMTAQALLSNPKSSQPSRSSQHTTLETIDCDLARQSMRGRI